ncbi:MAG: hypothetical protein IKX14_04670 [Neisseriaceae bacterium]|nr:hypothetical protein [Neisseriaceae bacterium]
MSNEQWVLCFALRQNNLFLDNASIIYSGSLKFIRRDDPMWSSVSKKSVLPQGKTK